jgi:hypothetical protein
MFPASPNGAIYSSPGKASSRRGAPPWVGRPNATSEAPTGRDKPGDGPCSVSAREPVSPWQGSEASSGRCPRAPLAGLARPGLECRAPAGHPDLGLREAPLAQSPRDPLRSFAFPAAKRLINRKDRIEHKERPGIPRPARAPLGAFPTSGCRTHKPVPGSVGAACL